jgi:hypothetical protein
MVIAADANPRFDFDKLRAQNPFCHFRVVRCLRTSSWTGTSVFHIAVSGELTWSGLCYPLIPQVLVELLNLQLDYFLKYKTMPYKRAFILLRIRKSLLDTAVFIS